MHRGTDILTIVGTAQLLWAPDSYCFRSSAAQLHRRVCMLTTCQSLYISSKRSRNVGPPPRFAPVDTGRKWPRAMHQHDAAMQEGM